MVHDRVIVNFHQSTVCSRAGVHNPGPLLGISPASLATSDLAKDKTTSMSLLVHADDDSPVGAELLGHQRRLVIVGDKVDTGRVVAGTLATQATAKLLTVQRKNQVVQLDPCQDLLESVHPHV